MRLPPLPLGLFQPAVPSWSTHMVSRPWWAFTHVSSKYTTDAAQFYFYAFAWGNLAAVVWPLAVHRCSACSHAFYIEIPSLSKLTIMLCVRQWRHLLTSPQIEGCPMWDIPSLCRIHVLFYELSLHWSHPRVSVPFSCCNASLVCTKHHGFWIHFLFGTVWTLTLRLGSTIEHSVPKDRHLLFLLTCKKLPHTLYNILCLVTLSSLLYSFLSAVTRS